MADKQPIFILADNTQRSVGKDAQRNNIMAARLVADTIKTTLGPKGMDKMLVSAVGDITVTNDGVSILEEMDIEHPAAKMMVEVAKTQEKEVGDGTTTAVILAGKLLENAEGLLDQKIHPTVIARGYRIAEERAQRALQKFAIGIKEGDEIILKNIVKTAMTGKGAENVREKLADLIVNAIKTIRHDRKINLENIKLEKKKGGSVEDTELIKGIVLDKERAHTDMPSRVENAKIALLDAALEIKSPETDTKISISTPEQLQGFLQQEENMLKSMVEKVKKTRANVLFCQKGIDDVAQYYLSKAGILAVRRIAKSDMEKLAKAVNAKVISNIDEISERDLGRASIVEEEREGEEGMLYIRGCENPRALTILIRGGTEHVVDEIERAIKDGLGDVASSIEIGKFVAGGGAIEAAVADSLRREAVQGREQLAVEKFAEALESIPKILAENSGMDPIDVLTEIKSLQRSKGTNPLDSHNFGVNILTGKVENMAAAGVIEPLKIKTQAISSATEVANMILRIDDVIASSGANAGPKGGMPPAGMMDYE